VDPVPDPLPLRKSGSAGNWTRDLWICSQKLWPVDRRGGLDLTSSILNLDTGERWVVSFKRRSLPSQGTALGTDLNQIPLSFIRYPNQYTDWTTLAHYYHEVFSLYSLGEVDWVLVLWPQMGLLYAPPWWMSIGYCWDDIWQGQTEMCRKICPSATLCNRWQMDWLRDWTRAFAVISRQLTARNIARPSLFKLCDLPIKEIAKVLFCQ
jgi:hypothetical protein